MNIDNQQLIELIYRSATDDGLYLQLLNELQELLIQDDNALPADLMALEASLVPHLQQSANISEQLFNSQHQQKLYGSLADQLPMTLLLLDGEGKVVFANQAGLGLLGLPHLNAGPVALSLCSLKQRQMLMQRIKQWSSSDSIEPEALMLQCQGDNASADVEGHKSLALLSPMVDAVGMLDVQAPDSAVAALFISQQPDASISSRLLQDLYGLTPAEAFIADKLANAHSTEEIAVMRNSKVATIRSYIKSILQKTGTSKQHELVSLLLRSPLVFQGVAKRKAVVATQDHLFALADGRQLSYRCYGNPKDKPLIHSHASLSCRLERPVDLDALLQQGIYLIVVERAGFGLSSQPVYNSLLQYADDVDALMTHLKLESAYFMGVVAGGAFAMAVAKAYPHRVKALLLLEAFAPEIAPQDIPGAPLFYRYFPRLCMHFPRIALNAMRLNMHELKRRPKRSYKHLLGLFNKVDVACLMQEPVRLIVLPQASESMRQGVEALLNDIVLSSSDWGFDIRDIQCHCHIFYGNGDPVATAFAGQLQVLLPNNTGHFRANQGFASMMYLQLADIIAELQW